MQSDDLFPQSNLPDRVPMGISACILRGFALPYMESILAAIADLERRARFRHMVTPGGFTMSVAMSNFGRLGWTTDRRGYRSPIRGCAPTPVAIDRKIRMFSRLRGVENKPPTCRPFVTWLEHRFTCAPDRRADSSGVEQTRVRV
jgi:alkylated DNA repair dioxygenase AlkB